MSMNDRTLMASRQPGHVWVTDLQVGDLGLDMGYLFIYFFRTENVLE